MKQKLTYKLVKSNSINDRDINRMYSLMQENYDFILLENFKKDLIKKDYIGLLIDNNMTIQGFTTYAFNPNNYSNKKYNILFSGDTVISENFTGTQELTKGWGKTVGFFIKKYPEKKLLWYLMSKGYKTYLYLPFFFKKYYPALEESRNDQRLKKIINEFSNLIYPDCWNEELGIIKFKKRLGQVKEKHILKSIDKKNKHIDFFLEKNPGYINGDELVCMAEVDIDNLLRFPKMMLVNYLNSNEN
tara:strand:+ start:4765 stop:5499 length:735 start_codon:yes stop_codon:yes gene_type:complete